MSCDYFTYRDITEKLFYGVALTESHMNNATEIIRQYLVDGGAGKLVNTLGIGIKVTTKKCVLLPLEVIRRRFVWIKGERKGEELDINEIKNIGMFLKHGALYGRYIISDTL